MIRAKFIEAEAIALLREASVLKPPAPLTRLASFLGVEVREGIDLAPRMKAHYDPVSRTISLARLPASLLRFPLAHEIGHIRLRHGGACSFQGEPSVDAMALEDADVRLDEEAEADHFAGSLLVPRAWLRERIDHRTRDELLRDFDVTWPVLLIAAMRYRIDRKLRLD